MVKTDFPSITCFLDLESREIKGSEASSSEMNKSNWIIYGGLLGLAVIIAFSVE